MAGRRVREAERVFGAGEAEHESTRIPHESSRIPSNPVQFVSLPFIREDSWRFALIRVPPDWNEKSSLPFTPEILLAPIGPACVNHPPSAAPADASEGPPSPDTARWLHQLVVRALFDDPAVLEHEDPVGVGIVLRRWAMTKLVRPCISARRLALDQPLALGVEVAGGLVEDEDLRVGQDGAGDR